jgi:type IV secretory pathway VirB2 component (pilin)
MAVKQEAVLTSFVMRLVCSLLLVFSTYNPTGYSYFHWLTGGTAAPVALKVVVGIGLVLVYGVVLTVMFAAFRGAGLIVGGLAALLFSAELVLVVMSVQHDTSWRSWMLLGQYSVLLAIALVIAFGVSWSHLVERLTGQQQKRYVR